MIGRLFPRFRRFQLPKVQPASWLPPPPLLGFNTRVVLSPRSKTPVDPFFFSRCATDLQILSIVSFFSLSCATGRVIFAERYRGQPQFSLFSKTRRPFVFISVLCSPWRFFDFFFPRRRFFFGLDAEEFSLSVGPSKSFLLLCFFEILSVSRHDYPSSNFPSSFGSNPAPQL